ncbi:UDP-3-O-(3-hydroxymyristoyl)glucosamine N-acyltransferase [Elusimicrobiota bacterium]
MKLTLSEVIKLIGEGTLEGDANYNIQGIASLKDAGSADISFYSSSTAVLKEQLAKTKAGAILFGPDLKEDAELYKGNRISVLNVRLAWTKLLQVREKELRKPRQGISPKADIASSAKIGANVSIGAFCVIEENVVIGANTAIHPYTFIGDNVRIGDDCLIYPRVVIREGCTLGNRGIIHAGAVIGSDGYGFVNVNGKHEKVPQIGIVEIHDDVEIGANCCIDRATTGKTIIGEGTKFDNAVHIGHNVTIGKHCLLVAQAGIAGSTTVGDDVIIGGQAAIRDNVSIGDKAIIGPQTGIIGNVKSGEVLFGTPGIDIKESIKLSAFYRKLPEMYRAFKKQQKAQAENNKTPA